MSAHSDYIITPERSQFDFRRPEWFAQYGIDGTVCAPLRESREEVDKADDDDISIVLRGMIEHPRVHLHVYDADAE